VITARVLDENWWKTAGELQKLCEPMVSLLRLMDAGGASTAIGKVYFKMIQIVQHVADIESLSELDRQTITGFANTDGQCCTLICTAQGLYWTRSTTLKHTH